VARASYGAYGAGKVQTTLLGPGWMTSPTFVNIASLILAFSWETAAAWQQMAAVAVPCCACDDLQVYTAVQGASETVEGLLFGTPCIAQFQRKFDTAQVKRCKKYLLCQHLKLKGDMLRPRLAD